jgi:S1-C subfamily serine protease
MIHCRFIFNVSSIDMIRLRLAAVACILISAFVVPSAGAEEFDAKQLQSKIYSAVEKSMPAVVAVYDRGAIFSAVIVSKEGHVLSAGHAVRPNRRYTVILPTGQRLRAVGLGSNERIDCGMIKITESGDWPVATMGHSSVLVKNQPVVGISYPGVLNADRGPVIRFGRITKPVTHNEGMILSTVKIEPGDSGGALLDLDGNVVGIHSNIRRDASENYAVPIDTYRRLWDELNEPRWLEVDGWPSLPKLGFRGAPAENRSGVEVLKVYEGGLAEKSGLKKGDVIVELGGSRVNSTSRVRNKLIEMRSTGTESFNVSLERGSLKKSIKFEVTNGQPVPDAIPELVRFERQFSTIESRLDNIVCKVSSQLAGTTNTIRATKVVGNTKGNLVTKNSEVGESPVVLTENGEKLPAKVVRRDVATDLVLLQVDGLPGKNGIDFSRVYGDLSQQPGRLLITPDADGYGDMSVWSTKYFHSPRTRASGGFLGVQPTFRNGNVVFARVLNGAAKKAGIKTGDVLLRLNSTVVRRQQDLFDFLKERDVNGKITALIRRGDEEMTKEIVLGAFPEMSRHVADNMEGGKSSRRDGFSVVISHDADIQPDECGGPVFDIDGNFVGINISRSSRTRCYVLPKSLVKKFLDGVQ